MRRLWLLGVLLFLGLVVWQAWRQDPYFYLSAHQMYLRAVRAHQTGDLRQSLAWAERTLAREPQHWQYRAFLAWRLLEAQRPAEALALFAQAWEQQPADLSLGRGQVLALERTGQREEALKLAEKLVQLQPQDAANLTLAAELAAARPETQEQAIQYYRRLLKLAPRDQAIRQHLVDLLLAQQRFAEAIPLQEEIVRDFPDNPEALHQLALLYAWQRDYEAAVPLYEKLLQLEAANQALRLEAAQTAAAAQKLDQALAHYLVLYRDSGGKADYARALARIWSQKGEHGSAAAVLAPLLESGEATLEDRRQQALELLVAGDYRGAFSAYRRLWEGGDTSKETLINLARLAAQRQQFNLAADLWDEARRRHLTLTQELRREAALAYACARRYREAVLVLEAVPRTDPKLLLFLAQMHLYQQNYGEAAHYYRRYLEHQPQDLAVRRQLAQTLALDPELRQNALPEYDHVLHQRSEPQDRLQKAAVLLQLAQDSADQRGPRFQQAAVSFWQEAEKELLQLKPAALSPELQRQHYKLLMWLGLPEAALASLEVYLSRQPAEREARLDQVRLLLACQRGQEALEKLRLLRGAAKADPDTGSPAELLALELEAALAAHDLGLAERAAWQLYLLPLGRQPLPANWRAAFRRHQDLPGRPELPPAVRVLLGRFLARKVEQQLDPTLVAIGVHLSLDNLADQALGNPEQRRFYQASLLLLSHFLPRISSFEELQQVGHRLPGLREQSPEFIATLSHFIGLHGRRDGKLQYLLLALEDYRSRQPVSAPGDLLYLASLALELKLQKEAVAYLEQAQRLRPHDPRLTTWRLQALEATHRYGQLLQALDQQPATAATRLALARIYLQRQQYDGAVTVLQEIDPGEPSWPEAQQLMLQAHRGRGALREALQLVENLEKRPEADAALQMAKGQILEALHERAGAMGAYQAVIRQGDAYQREVAQARLARSRGDWAGAYRHFAAALRERPQDIEILNELEQVRAQMRPYLAAHNLPPFGRGESRPEENYRPWQFSRYDRDPGLFQGRRGYPRQLTALKLPWALTPETALLQDRSRIRALSLNLGGGFWLGRLFPLTLAAGYRLVQQNIPGAGPSGLNLGLDRVFSQRSQDRTTWHRVDVTLGVGPLVLGESLRLRAEVSGRQYWRKMRQQVTQTGQIFIPFPPTFLNTTASAVLQHHETRPRLAGGLTATLALGPQTDLSLSYSRRDLFDQDPAAYPRLYQQWTKLSNAPLIMLHQVEAGLAHQLAPKLDLYATVAQAFFSDHNRRTTFYQGLRWQLVNEPRSHLSLTPSYYLALHRRQNESYFSSPAYHALGVSLDWDRQVFRLPTFVLQVTGQGVYNDGRWGPAIAGLVGLEEEPVHNLYLGLHYFFYKEWATDYWLHSIILGLNWRF